MLADRDWWRQAVVYQIYPRSFADADGDGVGDLRGVTSRVGHLVSLGVDAVWLSPFYPSALADGGYDVDDPRDVDPLLGTLEDFDDMVAALHAADIRVVVDVVPNHTSDRHAWFRAAVAAPKGSPERARYIFRDGAGDGSLPPNDWESAFGGPAWTRVADGQWYLHLFAPQQPDLNWDNPEVHEDHLRTLRFWADRGVDGFRVDVAHGLVKDLEPPFLPGAELARHRDELILAGRHPLCDRPEVHEIYAEWRRVLDEYDPPRAAVAEAWVPQAHIPRYASPRGLGQAFNFDLLSASWDGGLITELVRENLALVEQTGSSSTWVLSNHDVVRHPSRYGLSVQGREAENAWLRSGGRTPVLDAEAGLRRARAATLMALALPGSTYLFQGEELGLHEVPDLPESVLQDPTWARSGHTEKGRDGCRVPIPWTPDGPSYGFGSGTSHLPQPDWFGPLSVAVQDEDPESTLQLYRRALRLRRELLGAEDVEFVDAGPDVLHFARPAGATSSRAGGSWHCVTNFGPTPVPLPPGELLLTSADPAGASADAEPEGKLPSETTAWLMVGSDAG